MQRSRRIFRSISTDVRLISFLYIGTGYRNEPRLESKFDQHGRLFCHFPDIRLIVYKRTCHFIVSQQVFNKTSTTACTCVFSLFVTMRYWRVAIVPLVRKLFVLPSRWIVIGAVTYRQVFQTRFDVHASSRGGFAGSKNARVAARYARRAGPPFSLNILRSIFYGPSALLFSLFFTNARCISLARETRKWLSRHRTRKKGFALDRAASEKKNLLISRSSENLWKRSRNCNEDMCILNTVFFFFFNIFDLYLNGVPFHEFNIW